jgi:ankyrin repeat protein
MPSTMGALATNKRTQRSPMTTIMNQNNNLWNIVRCCGPAAAATTTDTCNLLPSSCPTTAAAVGMMTADERAALTKESFSSSSLIDDDASAATTTTADEAASDFPLHRALSEFATRSLMDDVKELESNIAALMEIWPDAVRTYDHRGMCPLHVACREGGVSLDVIKRLVRAWPDSIGTPTRNKKSLLPLHLACRYYAGSNKFQLLVFLIRSYPLAVRAITSDTKELPLHLCCRNYFCTISEILMLVESYPNACRVRNSMQELPLHIAIQRRYMQRVEKLSSQRNKKTSSFSRPPSDVGLEIIKYLMRMYPQSLSACNGAGELPLHIAVRAHQPVAIVQFVLDAFSSATDYVDDAGRTPLHLAVSRTHPSMETIQLLLKEDAAATIVKDSKGKIPLDYATRTGSLDLIYTLLRAYPKSIRCYKDKSCSVE